MPTFPQFSARLAACAFAILLVAGCGIGAPTPPNDNQNLDSALSTAQGIELSTPSLQFVADTNYYTPLQAKSVTAFLTDDVKTLSVAIYGDPQTGNWLSLDNNPSAEGGSAHLELSVQDTSLSTGIYDATVRVIGRGADANPIAYRDLHIQLIKLRSAGLASSFYFRSAIGDAYPPSTQYTNFNLKADDKVAIVYVSNDSVDWLSAKLGAGSDPSKLAISVSPAKLAVGYYNAKIYIVPRDSTQDTLLITVTYDVSSTPTAPSPLPADPQLFSPASLTFSLGVDTTETDLTKTIVVKGAGTWTAAASVPWLSLTKHSGASGETLGVKILPAELDTDFLFTNYGITRYSNISFTLTNASGHKTYATLSVSAEKAPLPTNFLPTTRLNFLAGINASASDITKTVTMGGDKSVSWAVTSTSNWILLTHTSGQGGDTFTASLNPDVVKKIPSYYYPVAGNLSVVFTTLQGLNYSANIALTLTNLAAPANFISPNSIQFDVTNNTIATDLTKSIKAGSGSATWTVTSSAPWIAISPTSGVAGTAISVKLNLATFAKQGSAFASSAIDFTFTNALGMSFPFSAAVVVNNSVAYLNSVTPYVALTGVAGQKAVVRGVGFTPDTLPRFGDLDAVNTSFVSSTELLVTLPTFANDGRYEARVQILPAALAALQSPVAVVTTQETMASVAQTLDYPNTVGKKPLRVVYDAERQALLVGVAYPPTPTKPGLFGEILRYVQSNGGWILDSAANSIAYANLSDFALSADGQTVIAVSAASMTAYDPVTLAPGNSRTLGGNGYASVAVTNDGQAIVFESSVNFGYWGLNRYSLIDWNAASSPITSGYNSSYTPAEAYRMGISLDGSRVAFVAPDYGTPIIKQYLANGGVGNYTMSISSYPAGFIPSLNRHATRFAIANTLQNNIYDSTDIQANKLLGVLGTTGGTSATLSPDGSRLYTCCSSVTSQGITTVTLHTYDLTTFTAADGYREVGAGTNLPSDPGTGFGVGVRLAMSYDGKTIFLAGENAIFVIPAP